MNSLKGKKNGVELSAEWQRVPPVGQALEGVYRSTLFRLIKTGEVRSAGIKQPGSKRTGCRLVHIPSLRAWIAAHADQGAPAARESEACNG